MDASCGGVPERGCFACSTERRESGLPELELPQPTVATVATRAVMPRVARASRLAGEWKITYREYESSIKSALIRTGPSSSWTKGEPGADSRISGVPRDRAECAPPSFRLVGSGGSESLEWLKTPRRPPKR